MQQLAPWIPVAVRNAWTYGGSPFTDFDSNGVEGVFNSADAAILVKTLRDLEATRHKPLSNRSVDNVNVTALSRILRATDPHDKISWVGRRNSRCLDRK
jgi:hypothetical protein